MVKAGIVLVALRLLPSAYEKAELEPIAAAIASVSATREDAASLIALGWHESKYARAVLEGRCHELGERACDRGLALGPWQLHQAACSRAWAMATPTSNAGEQYASLTEQARCALQLLRWCGVRGTSRTGAARWSAAFSCYAGRDDRWLGSVGRVYTMTRLLGRWAVFEGIYAQEAAR